MRRSGCRGASRRSASASSGGSSSRRKSARARARGARGASSPAQAEGGRAAFPRAEAGGYHPCTPSEATRQAPPADFPTRCSPTSSHSPRARRAEEAGRNRPQGAGRSGARNAKKRRRAQERPRSSAPGKSRAPGARAEGAAQARSGARRGGSAAARARERERQRLREEEEKRRREAEERAQKAKQEERLAARAERGPGAFVEEAQARSRREREFAAKPRSAAANTQALGQVDRADAARASRRRGRRGARHADRHLRLPARRIRRPRTPGQDRLGAAVAVHRAQLKLSDVRIGDDLHIPQVRAYPEFSSLLGPRKTFSRIEIDGAKLAQAAVGQALFASIKAESFAVGQVAAGPRTDRGPRSAEGARVRGRVRPRRRAADRGRARPGRAARQVLARRQGSTRTSAARPSRCRSPRNHAHVFRERHSNAAGMTISEWDASLLNGTVSGTANMRWGDSWTVDGVVTARNVYAAVFAPRSSPTARPRAAASSRCAAPRQARLDRPPRRQLYRDARRAGSIDLTRAIQTGGKFATGRTEFSEMNGQATYDRGAVALRNITLGAGQLNAGASADIAQKRRAFGPHRRRRAGCLPDDARDALPRRHREGASGQERCNAPCNTPGNVPRRVLQLPGPRALSESRLARLLAAEEDRFRRERRGGAVPLLRRDPPSLPRPSARAGRLLDDGSPRRRRRSRR